MPFGLWLLAAKFARSINSRKKCDKKSVNKIFLQRGYYKLSIIHRNRSSSSSNNKHARPTQPLLQLLPLCRRRVSIRNGSCQRSCRVSTFNTKPRRKIHSTKHRHCHFKSMSTIARFLGRVSRRIGFSSPCSQCKPIMIDDGCFLRSYSSFIQGPLRGFLCTIDILHFTFKTK